MHDTVADKSDAECVALARAGHESARTALVARHHASCLRYARHLLGDERDAEDVVQDTFMRAFVGLAGYSERDTFRAWLFKILVNRCRTAAAGRSRRRARYVHDETAAARAAVPGPEPMVDTQRALVRALDGLDVPHREAFLLRVGEDLDYDEMARLTGDGESALRMRVKRARDHVRAHWPGASHGI